MLLVGEWNQTEWVAGAIAATLTTLAAAFVWHASGLRVRIAARDVVSGWTVPAVVVHDFGVVLWGLLARSASSASLTSGCSSAMASPMTEPWGKTRGGCRRW
jgi:hypothetical protein